MAPSFDFLASNTLYKRHLTIFDIKNIKISVSNRTNYLSVIPVLVMTLVSSPLRPFVLSRGGTLKRKLAVKKLY